MTTSGPGDTPQIYIFKAMMQQAGHQKLKQIANTLAVIDEIKNSSQVLWLLRESATKLGMLTIDYIIWDNTHQEWQGSSTRIALSSAGWCNADKYDDALKQALRTFQAVTSDTVADYNDSLLKYIANYRQGPIEFKLEYRVNPLAEEQCTSEIYSSYIIMGPSKSAPEHKIKPSASVSLTQGVTQAITCELTGKPFKQPVVMKRDINHIDSQGIKYTIRKGTSYEKCALNALGINANDYYRNFLLERIIDRLGCKEKTIIEKLSSERLEDPIMNEVIDNPMIIPSGHTFSQSTLDRLLNNQCPLTKNPFKKTDIVPNTNIKNFINEWPKCYAILISQLSQKDESIKKRLSAPPG